MASQVVEAGSLQEQKGEDWVLTNTPVVILPKVTHSQFTNITRIQNIVPDMKAIIPLAEAQDAIASTTLAFIALNSNPSNPTTLTKAQTELKSRVAETQNLVGGYLKSLALDLNSFCGDTQRILAGDQVNGLSTSNTIYTNLFRFAQSKPSVSANGTVLTTSMQFNPNFFPFNTGSSPQSPENVACKCETNESIAKSRGVGTTQAGTCQDVVAKVIEEAKGYLTKEQLERYEKDGRKLRAAKEGDMKNSGLTWLPSGLRYVKKEVDGEKVTEVVSTALRTSITSPVGKYILLI
ncbi:hypothetical protein HK102_011172 [Quaeritorhiza haematococci]|nr:hypothetical protein HK102_011172 [Quaeritorhiza haematococci]